MSTAMSRSLSAAARPLAQDARSKTACTPGWPAKNSTASQAAPSWREVGNTTPELIRARAARASGRPTRKEGPEKADPGRIQRTRRSRSPSFGRRESGPRQDTLAADRPGRATRGPSTSPCPRLAPGHRCEGDSSRHRTLRRGARRSPAIGTPVDPTRPSPTCSGTRSSRSPPRSCAGSTRPATRTCACPTSTSSSTSIRPAPASPTSPPRPR